MPQLFTTLLTVVVSYIVLGGEAPPAGQAGTVGAGPPVGAGGPAPTGGKAQDEEDQEDPGGGAGQCRDEGVCAQVHG